MIKRIAIRKDWTISMSEFRNFAEKCQWEIDKLEEENKKLKKQIEQFKKWVKAWTKIIERLEEENKKLKETIKDHQLYEEKLEHRIIELEELLHWE